VATVEVEVVPDFLHSLEGSFVGRLNMGVEVRALQTKLWLAGFQKVRVVVMGGGLVLIGNSDGEELKGPVCKKGWWGGLFFDIKRWTPNLVSSKKEVWLNMFGIPLHVWGESTFKALANRCGSFISTDAGTTNMRSLEMARVKVEVPIWEQIDVTVKLVVQGATFWVKLVEEGGRGREGEEENDDQLDISDVGSSCASGGQAAEMVALEGLDDVDTDSEASDGEQCAGALRSQVVRKSKSSKGDVGVCGGKSDENAEIIRVIPSTDPMLKETSDNLLVKSPSVVRGSTSLVCVDKDADKGGGQGVNSNSITCSPLHTPLERRQVGPGLRQVAIAGSVQETPGYGSVSDSVLGPVNGVKALGWDSLIGPVTMGQGVNNFCNPVISVLDNMIHQSGHKLGGERACSYLSEEDPSDSSSTPQPYSDLPQPSIGKSKGSKLRKAQMPISSILGPKCLRFAGVVNNNSCLAKRRNNPGVPELVSLESRSQPAILQEGQNSKENRSEKQVIEVEQVGIRCSQGKDVEPVASQSVQGLALEVVLPFQQPPQAQSGVNLLLSDDSIQDVEGFLVSRENPESKKLEAQKLLADQQELGFTFNQNLEEPVVRMVDMEVRDRAEFVMRQESPRPQ
jgi:hypothetical protein